MEGYTCLRMWNILLNWNVFFETTNLTNSKNLEEKWQIIIVDYPLGGRNYERAPLVLFVWKICTLLSLSFYLKISLRAIGFKTLPT